MRIADEVVEASKPELTGAHRELLMRVVASATFGRAERLTSLLTYICEQSFKGQAHLLCEQHIGEAVFGRPHGYDCSIDGIVRTQASRLRQRLTLYFEAEGRFESIRIVVLPGGYVPVFESRMSVLQPEPAGVEAGGKVAESAAISLPPGTTAASASINAVATTLPERTWWPVLAAAVALGAVCLLAGWVTLTRLRSKPAVTQSLLWAELLPAGRSTLVVPGDSSLVMWQGLMNRDLTLSEYVRGSYLDAGPSAMSAVAADIGARRYTSIVDLNIVKALATLAQQRSSSVNVRYARDVRPNDLKRGNVVLIGDFEANPWIRIFEPSMNFVLTLERAHKTYVIQNRRPQGSEPATWISNTSASDHARAPVFAIVADVPNLDGEGSVLIIEGETMAGTECAWDFVSDDTKFLSFLNSIGSKSGVVPHFEVLLSTQSMNGSATRGSVLAVRTYP